MKFLIYGYYGGMNLGDEAILARIIHILKTNFKNSQITVISENPSYTQKNHEVSSIKNSIIRNPLGLLKEIIKSEYFILGGGGMLSDWQRLSPFIWLSLPLIARILGKKVIIYSVGLNPFKTIFGKLLLKLAISYSSIIIVRDKFSKDCIDSAIGKSSKIFVTIDPVISLKIDKNNYFDNFLKKYEIDYFEFKNSIKIGIIPSSFFHINKLWSNSEKRFLKLKDTFRDLITFLTQTFNAKIFLIPQSVRYDRSFCLSIYSSLDKRIQNKTIVFKDLNTVKNLFNVFSNMDFIHLKSKISDTLSLPVTKLDAKIKEKIKSHILSFKEITNLRSVS